MSTLTTVYGFTKPAQGDTPWTTQANGDYDSIDSELARPRIVFNSPVVGATTTCDLSLARMFKFTVSQATTLAFSNVPSSSFSVRIRLLVTNGSAFVLTFPASVSWLAGIAPSLKATGVDEIELETVDGGVTWYAGLRNLRPGTLYHATMLTTTSGVDASLGSYPLPANALGVDSQALRISVGGLGPAGGATVNIRFGASQIATIALGANAPFLVTILLSRDGAASQRASFLAVTNVTPSSNVFHPTETLSGAVTIDFRGNATVGGQTLTYYNAIVEYLARA